MNIEASTHPHSLCLSQRDQGEGATLPPHNLACSREHPSHPPYSSSTQPKEHGILYPAGTRTSPCFRCSRCESCDRGGSVDHNTWNPPYSLSPTGCRALDCLRTQSIHRISALPFLAGKPEADSFGLGGGGRNYGRHHAPSKCFRFMTPSGRRCGVHVPRLSTTGYPSSTPTDSRTCSWVQRPRNRPL